MSIVKSLSVGDGDMYYITHNSDNFTIIDCCMPEEDRSRIVKELESESKNKGITRFISTHPDDDHIFGLTHLNYVKPIINFYCVENKATKPDETEDFNQYCALRAAEKAFYLYKGCRRKWLNMDSDEQDGERRGNSGIDILWPITSNEHYREELKKASEGKNPNNISPIIKYSLKTGAAVLWMGDLMEEFMEKIKDEITMDSADILFAPHHGRDKVPEDWLEEMKPKIVIIGEAPSEDLNYYYGYSTMVMTPIFRTT